jgi:hypothetical protein
MQTYHVNIVLPDRHGDQLLGEDNVTDFVRLLSEYGSPRIVSYVAAPDLWRVNTRAGVATMVLEFLSRDKAVAFAQYWFGKSVEEAQEYVETILELGKHT